MDETFFNALLELNEIIARRSFMQRTQFLQEHNLSNSQMMSLFHLLHNKSVSLNNLAQFLGISNPAVSQLIEKLVRSDLVKRIPNPKDKRGKLLELTEKGKELTQEGKLVNQQLGLDLVNSLTEDELPTIQKAIEIILRKFNPDYSQRKNHI
ncbi:MAG: MarR family transcriptional regulator [Anaerolineaceae bacterium]|nr:MarR family transcriptional regulator [Anaerolineaceae bacterium]